MCSLKRCETSHAVKSRHNNKLICSLGSTAGLPRLGHINYENVWWRVAGYESEGETNCVCTACRLHTGGLNKERKRCECVRVLRPSPISRTGVSHLSWWEFSFPLSYLSNDKHQTTGCLNDLRVLFSKNNSRLKANREKNYKMFLGISSFHFSSS